MKNNRIKTYKRFEWKKNENQDTIMLVDSAEKKIKKSYIILNTRDIKLFGIFLTCMILMVLCSTLFVEKVEKNNYETVKIEPSENIVVESNEPAVVEPLKSSFVNLDVIASERVKNPKTFEVGYCYATLLDNNDNPFKNKGDLEFHSIICIENIKNEYVQYRFICQDFNNKYITNKTKLMSDKIYGLDYFNTRIGKMEDVLRYK
jgi:hypothetical protein